MIKRIASSLLAAVLTVSPLTCFAEEDGGDVFLKALDAQQRGSTIFSGKGSYKMTKDQGEKSEEEIPKVMDMPNASDSACLAMDFPRSEKDQYSKKQYLSGSFRFDLSKDDYQYFESQTVFKGVSAKPVIAIEKTPSLKNLSKMAKPEAVMLDPAISEAIVDNKSWMMTEFWQFGRLRGPLALLMTNAIAEKGIEGARDDILKLFKLLYSNKNDVKVLEIVETKPCEDGSTAYTLEISVEDKVVQRYVIAPDLGYVCPCIELYDMVSGNLVEKYEAKNFVAYALTGLYYPSVYIESHYDVATGKCKETREYKIDMTTLKLNEVMNPQDFSVGVLEGFHVVDARDGKNVVYSAIASGFLSLDQGGLELDKISWLTRDGSDSPTALVVNAHRVGILTRGLFAAVGVGLIVWVLFRRRRDKTTV